MSALPKASSPSPASGLPPAAPLAMSSTVSLVLVWPSTLTQLKVCSAASRRSRWASAAPTGASVRMMPSIVAIRGPIIAAPLAMPKSV